MKFTIKHIGAVGTGPSKIIELTCEGFGSSITEDVTNLRGEVSDDFIRDLRWIADELEEQNNKLKEANK